MILQALVEFDNNIHGVMPPILGLQTWLTWTIFTFVLKSPLLNRTSHLTHVETDGTHSPSASVNNRFGSTALFSNESSKVKLPAYDASTVQETEDQNHQPAPEDSPNDRILPNSRQALICYGIPDVTASLVTQLLPSDNLVEMNSNIQPPRFRNQRRRTYGGERFRPYRIPNLNLFIGVRSRYCNTDTEEEIFTSVDSRVESSFRPITKRRGQSQCIENFLDIQQESENRSLPPENRSLSENRLQLSVSDSITSVPSVSNREPDSMENFHSRLQSYSPHLQSPPPTISIENSHQSSNSSNEVYLEPVSATFLNSFFKSNNAHSKETFKSTRRALKIVSNHTKLYHDCDEDLAPLQRLIPDIPLPTISAHKLANNLIKLSRYLKSPNLNELCCLNCCHIPVLPVTGQCGHTRCMRCILLHGACPCGVSAPKTLFVNTIVREIVEKMMKYVKNPRIIDPGPHTRTPEQRTIPFIGVNPRYSVRRSLQCRTSREYMNSAHSFSRPRMPMTVQARHRRARELMYAGKFHEAAPHLARVAASTEPFARSARILLTQIISAMCKVRKRRTVTRELCQSVREQSAHSWVSASDLECVLCTNTFTNPVSTPCGHTYCRSCIERSLYYKKKCALCLGPLENFRLADTRDTIFISSILASIDVLPSPEETDVIPVVTCYVAFPGMPCPLFIFDPRYWLMVRRVLESGSRRFGMLAYERGHTFADYGTVLEICDCVVLEDSRCIVSTVGVSRFKVLERRVKDGCDVARIQPLTDIQPTQDEVQDLHLLGSQISCKAQTWLKNMDEAVREEIETAFGTLPYDETPDQWWKTSDGPNWLWWLIAILPLKSEIKILILSTRSLLKRMLAVSRTLDVMDSDSFTQTNQSDSEPPLNELNQEWLNRNR
ncbi:unnamed protein product [Euphydryas editha]|uniref:LON peptidase N-terminal domain and RING finger protein 2 n=1 Tax=Euphydryas editha TaxID=104508 RepID=A0AAU9UVJ2_EUPED|nr:unnamed protein product [Euphydryas editha]